MPCLVAATRKFVLASCLVVCAASAQTLTFSPSAVSFPGQKVGTTNSNGVFLSVVNPSAQAVSLSSVTITGANASDFAVGFNSCGSVIAAANSCYLNITFAPTALGARTATLNFSENAAATLQTVALSGAGDGPIITLQVVPTAESFYPQNVGTTSYAQTVVLTSTGNTAVTLSSVAISGPNASDFFVSSNDCGTELSSSPSAFCFVAVNFAPTAAGVRSATLSITDNATGSPQTVSLSGTGQTPTSALTASPSSLSFGMEATGSTSSLGIDVVDTGTTPINFASFVISGSNAGDFVISGNSCGNPLSPGYRCGIGVSFTPSAVGMRSAVLTVNVDGSGSPFTIPLSGTGQAPVKALTISPAAVTFPAVSVTSNDPQFLTLTNSGNLPFNISSNTISGPNAGDFTLQGSCVGSYYPADGPYLPAGCTIVVLFSPKAVGPRSATLTITDSVPGSPQTVPLTGTGQAAPTLNFNPGSINFATVEVNATAKQVLTITNSGTQPTSVPGFELAGTDVSDFAITSSTCNSNLNAGSSCALTISFTPSSPGARSANVTTFGDWPQVIFLGGNGASLSRTLAFQTLQYSFGNQTVGTTSSYVNLNVSNTGNMEINFSSIAITGANASDFAITENSCGPGQFGSGPPSFLPANSGCGVSVTFSPSASGVRSAALTFTGDQTGSPQSLPLTGNGITPNVAVSTSPLELLFGSQPVGVASADQTVTLQNTGSALLNISSATISGANASDFINGGLGCLDSYTTNGVAPGKICQVSVIFMPSGPGVRTAVLSIADNAGSSPQLIPLTGTGLGLPKTLSASPAAFSSVDKW